MKKQYPILKNHVAPRNLVPLFWPLALSLLFLLQVLNIRAQYVQTGLPIRDFTVAGIDLQAYDISMSADGITAVAGYPNYNNCSGGFIVYQRTGNNWNEVFSYYNTGSDRSMGLIVTLSGDGNTVVVCGANSIYWIYVRQGSNWNLQRKAVNNNNATPGLSHDGNTMILGNKIWVRNNNQWTLEASINQGNVSGYSGVLSADGNTAVVNQVVSVRQGSTWVQQGAQLVPHFQLYPNTVPSSYSFSVLSGDGNTYVMGFYALSHDYLGIFKRTGNIWVQETLLGGIYPMGADVTISHNGNNLLFVSRYGGAFRTKASKTYLSYWHRTLGTWSSATISAGDTVQGSYTPVIYMRAAMDSTGTQVLVDNRFSDSLYGGLRYYTLNGLNWLEQGTGVFNNQAKGFCLQGNCVTISGDGSTMISAGVKDGYGAVWTYTRNGNNWVQQGQPLNCPEPPDRDRHFAQDYGRFLALSADGNTMAVSAAYDETYPSYNTQDPLTRGAVYLFNRTGGTWQFSQKITVPYDTSHNAIDGGFIKLSNDGRTLLCSSINQGAWVFAYNNSTWQLQQKLPNLANASTYQADLSGDGNTAVIVQKPNGAGHPYVYKRNGTTWQLQQGPIAVPNTSYPANFPAYMALSNDGSCFALADIYGAPDKIYFYKDSAGVWVPYGNICDSTCAPGANVDGQLCLSATGDTLFNVNSGSTSSPYISIDVYVRAVGKWVYTYSFSAVDNALPVITPGYSWPEKTIAISGDLKYAAYGYPYSGGGNGSIYPFVRSNLNVTGTIGNAACPSIHNGKVRITVTGGTPPINIAWSTGAGNIDSITNLASGTYGLTVTDADGIEVVRQYIVNASHTMQLQNVATNYNCGGNTGDIAITINGGTAPYTFVWNTSPVQTNDTVFNLATGAYHFTVTDSAGCTYTDSAVLNPNIYWNNVTGNQPDCVHNNGSAFIQTHGGTAPYSYQWSNNDTTAATHTLAPGTYHVTATDFNGCSTTDSITLTPFCANVLQGHLFFDTNNNCVQDSGEQNATGYNLYADGLTYYTYGNTDAQGNYTILIPTPGTLSVKIGNWNNCNYALCSGHAYPLTVTFAGVGDTITGADFALVDTTYDLSVFTNSSIFHPGFSGDVDVHYYDVKGSTVPGGVVTVTYDSVLTFNSAIPTYTTHDPLTRTLTFNVGNVANVLPIDTTQRIRLNFTLGAGVPIHNLVSINCSISPTQNDCNTFNNDFRNWLPVGGSYDPNTKESSTNGRIGYADSLIDYTIHFQNTGNDTTHFIVVTDTLPGYLDPASVQTMSTSHLPYTFSLSGEGILQWRFDPIYLPDSSTDELHSHGYVTFRVRVANNPPVNTTVQNHAQIYFDYNEPVVTNTVSDTVVCRFYGATNHATICANQVYNFNGRVLTAAGTYKTAYRSRLNCDSVVTLVLAVNNGASPSQQVNAAICKGQSFSFYGSSLLNTGVYTTSVPNNTGGCDTTVTLNLLVYDTAGPEINASICQGEAYLFDGNNLTAAGSYLERLQGTGGCDSVIKLNLQVADTTASSTSATICNGDSYMFDGNSLTAAGTYVMRLQNMNGCDSTVMLTLSVNSIHVTATPSHDTLLASGSNNYTWINCNNGSIVGTGSIYEPTASGSYAVIGSENSCTDTSNCVSVTINGIAETGPDVIDVFPNPFSNATTIKVGTSIPQQYDIELYDLTGRLLAAYKNQNSRTFILRRNNIAAGAYMLKLISNGTVVATRRLVVQY